MRTAPVGDELASIIILCCNQLAYTRLCVESVLKHSRPPYELVVVNNGSTDGTADYLDSVRNRVSRQCVPKREFGNEGLVDFGSEKSDPGPAPKAGPTRVEVIHNRENVGFAKGCNQALARARGD